MPLSEHVYCVTVPFKMTEQVEQQMCIKFCIKFEHSSVENIQMIQKVTAMDNWWLAASSWQCAHSCITSHAEFFGKTSNHPGDSASPQPIFEAPKLLTFLQTKITFEREEISDHGWDSGKYDGAADSYWVSCSRCQGTYFEGGWGVIVLCTMFHVSSLINVSIFHIKWLSTFWTDLVCHVWIKLLWW